LVSRTTSLAATTAHDDDDEVAVVLFVDVSACNMEVTRTRSLTSQRGGGKVESVGATSWSSGTKSAVQVESDLPSSALLIHSK